MESVEHQEGHEARNETFHEHVADLVGVDELCLDKGDDVIHSDVSADAADNRARSAPVLRDRGDNDIVPFFGFGERRRLSFVVKEPVFGNVFIKTALNRGTCKVNGCAPVLAVSNPMFIEVRRSNQNGVRGDRHEESRAVS